MGATTRSQKSRHGDAAGQAPFLLDRLREAGFRVDSGDAGAARGDALRIFLRQREYRLEHDQGGEAALGTYYDAARVALLEVLHEGLIHDLRSPLNSISINAEMLQTLLPDSAETPLDRSRVARYAGAITEQVAALAAAAASVTDLLSVSNEEAESGPLEAMLKRALAITAPTLRYWRVETVRDLDGSRCLVGGNAAHMQLALTALLICAAGGARQGDRMTVTTVAEAGTQAAAITCGVSASEHGAPGDAGSRVLEGLSSRVEQSLLRALVAAIRIVDEAGGRVSFSGDPGQSITITLPTR